MTTKKSFDRGYWVSKLFYYQSIIYNSLNAFRFRSLSFFSAANPAMAMGGLLDDKKSATYKLLPTHTYPKTIVNLDRDILFDQMAKSKITYPIIVKPDIGFKGYLVKKVNSKDELLKLIDSYNSVQILVQEFIDYEREFSVLIYRLPNVGKVGISSLVEKTYPQVIGDGNSTLLDLIIENDNPFLKKDWIIESFKERLEEVPELGVTIRIDEIGNYSRGAKFHSKNDLITNSMIAWAENILGEISGLNFCRIDLKANSLEEMLNGQFKILEINGAKSEPLHIYDPQYSFLTIIRDIHHHWSLFKDVVAQNVSKSFTFPSFADVYKSWVITKNVVK